MMFGSPNSLRVVSFGLATDPAAETIGLQWSGVARTEATFRFSFGSASAAVHVPDVWTSCCELYLQAQLAAREKLPVLSLGGQRRFTLTNVTGIIVCQWSREHIFAVRKREFVSAIETLVDRFLAGMPETLREGFVQLGASMIRNEPMFGPLKELESAR